MRFLAQQTRSSCKNIDVIAPHLKRRLSGVTTSLRALLPIQKKLGLKIATLGPGLPANMPRLCLKDFFYLWQKPENRPFRIWHARRNNEFIIGLWLRDVLRLPLRVIFTFATQKKPTAYKKWLLKKADYVIATSALNSRYLEVPHRIILHGVDIEKFHNKRDDKDFLENTEFPGKYAIGCFGRIRASKGTDIFVEALLDLLPYYPDWTAFIIGQTTRSNQKFLHKLQTKIKRKGLEKQFIFLPEAPNIELWYRRLTLFVSPSHSEGFGLTVLEAMASHNAVIAGNVGAFPQLVHENTGVIVQKIDKEHFKNAIEEFFKHPAKAIEFGNNARTFVEKNFSLLKEAQSLNELYEALWRGTL